MRAGGLIIPSRRRVWLSKRGWQPDEPARRAGPVEPGPGASVFVRDGYHFGSSPFSRSSSFVPHDRPFPIIVRHRPRPGWRLDRAGTALFHLLLHLWLVAVLPLVHATDAGHRDAEQRAATLAAPGGLAGAAAAVPDVVGEPGTSGAGHDVQTCALCRALETPRLGDRYAFEREVGWERATRSVVLAVRTTEGVLPPALARDPPAVLG